MFIEFPTAVTIPTRIVSGSRIVAPLLEKAIGKKLLL